MLFIRYIKSHIGEIVGFGMIGLMVLVWGFFLSKHLLFGALHTAVLVTTSLVFCYSTFKSLPSLKKKLPFLLGFAAHFVLFSIEQGKIFFSLRLLSLFFPYLFVAAFGSSFIPLYAGRAADAKIRKHGVDAMAIITEAWDEGARLLEDGVFKSYKMKLTLEILDQPESPYKVTGVHWVSEFHIHLMTGGKPVPVKVDRNDPTRVALNFGD